MRSKLRVSAWLALALSVLVLDYDTRGDAFPAYAVVTDGWDELGAANAAGKVPGLAFAKSFR